MVQGQEGKNEQLHPSASAIALEFVEPKTLLTEKVELVAVAVAVAVVEEPEQEQIGARQRSEEWRLEMNGA